MSTSSGAGDARGGGSQLARGALLALALAAVAGLGLLASACGGSSSGEGVAQVGSTEATSTGSEPQNGSSAANPTAYASCMRKNGLPKFPDPDSQGRFAIQGGQALDPNSAVFKAAEKACEKFMPRGGNEAPSPEEQARGLREALRYSACMRQNGVPGFPDPKPNAEGGIGLDGDAASFNPDSPQYKQAEEACKELAPGVNGGAQSRKSAP